MPDTELQLALSQLFSSPLCERLLAGCVRETCLTRMTLARDILLLICVLQHGEVGGGCEGRGGEEGVTMWRGGCEGVGRRA